ncbi:MAG TPA: ABC transporter permease [Actinoallomurus sp.]|nr:ABC transporter permease [Actinoallomurus sp.]
MTATAIRTPPGSARRLGFLGVLRSEFLKLRSVPSTFWTLALTVVFNVVFAALAATFVAGRLSAADRQKVDGIRLALAGLHLSQVAIGVLGVLVMTSEYGTGMIRVTFAAVPRRRVVLAAKAMVFAATALVVGTVSSFAAYFVFQTLLSGSGTGLKSSLGDPGVLRAVTGGGLYLAVLGLLGLGLGTVIRAGAGAIATLFGLLFAPALLLDLLPHSWQSTVGPYLPMQAGSQIFVAVSGEPDSLGTWTGFGVFCLYAVAAVTVGFVLLDRRDA